MYTSTKCNSLDTSKPNFQSEVFLVLHGAFGHLAICHILLHLQIWYAQQVVLNKAWFKLICYKSTRYSKFACVVFKVTCVALLPCWNLSTHSRKILLIWYSTWFEKQILSLRKKSIKGWFGPMLVWYIGECMVIIINNPWWYKRICLWVSKL